jgi:4-alpha-glucanotransferase
MAKAKKDSGKRLIGVVCPVGALRSARSTGVGEFPDIAGFAALCADMGVGLIQLLPVNDTAYESSPYSAVSAFALNPLYLRISDLPEAEDFAKEIAALGKKFEKEKRFPYYKIVKAKMELLGEIFAANKEAITASARKTAALGKWIEQNPWVKNYAVYRTLKDQNGQKTPDEWKAFGKVSAKDIAALWASEASADARLFYAWLQKALDEQFTAAAAEVSKLGILLEGDIPILMNRDSCDVWAHPEYFRLDLSAGAPPDMYSPQGQNWGFPIYDWAAQAKDDYAFWRGRLAVAEKYYHAYRIDHVLGFFRIWASNTDDTSGASKLGRYIPYTPVKRAELAALGFDDGRVRWLSEPHIPTDELRYAAGAGADEAFNKALSRIGNEELWLFKTSIKGVRDIDALGLSHEARNCLVDAWNNRLLLEYEPDLFFPLWYGKDSRSWRSLGDTEKNVLDALFKKKQAESEKVWEKEGKKLLSILSESSAMLPCAEDLGAVPDCVPRVLAALNIMGLRVVRWTRDWAEAGEPYIPLSDYPELSVCTPAVHDSSTLRQWWEGEADRAMFAAFAGVPSLGNIYNPGTARTILGRIAGAASRWRVFQIQDILHLSSKWYSKDPEQERINVPGTYNDFNWTYRLPAPVEELARDKDLVAAVNDLGLK